jgi:hypothetical protein
MEEETTSVEAASEEDSAGGLPGLNDAADEDIDEDPEDEEAAPVSSDRIPSEAEQENAEGTDKKDDTAG